MVRPEDIVVSADNSRANAHRVSIDRRVFLGSVSFVSVRLGRQTAPGTHPGRIHCGSDFGKPGIRELGSSPFVAHSKGGFVTAGKDRQRARDLSRAAWWLLPAVFVIIAGLLLAPLLALFIGSNYRHPGRAELP